MPRPLTFHALRRALVCLLLVTMPFNLGHTQEEQIRMNMRDADLRAMIQWMADVTGKNFIVHREVQGVGTIVSTEPVTKDEAWQMFLAVLDMNGYVAVQSGDSTKIIPAENASQSAGSISSGGAGDMATSIIRLRNVPAQELAGQLQALVGPGGYLGAYEKTNSLIVSDRSDNIARINELVRQIDGSGQSAFDAVKLEHADALEIAKSLTALLPNNPGTGGINAAISVDERSNSILLAGNQYQREKLKALIRQLDTPISGEAGTQVVYLHYVDAEELVPVLRGTVQSIQEDNPDSGSSIGIEASAAANALVINGPPAMQAKLKKVISQLDIRRAQVLVEALIVDVIGDDTQDLGISWVSTNLADENASGGFVANNTTGQLGVADITTDANGNITNVSPGPGLSFGYLQDGDLRAVFRALSTKTKANIISTPSVVALDNEEATLLVGQNVPFITGQSTGSASQTDNPFTTVQRQDIGTTLKITPRINQGDSVTLSIEQTTERISNESVAGAVDLVTNKRQIVTNALIRDSEILVIGGLISDEEAEVQTKVPVLGDIPGLGLLFRSTSKEKQKTNLMVFIHPIILKDEIQMAGITQRRYQFMREVQQNYREKKKVKWKNNAPMLPEFEEYAPRSHAPFDQVTPSGSQPEQDEQQEADLPQ